MVLAIAFWILMALWTGIVIYKIISSDPPTRFVGVPRSGSSYGSSLFSSDWAYFIFHFIFDKQL